MIAFGSAITKPDVFRRCARPGLDLAAEPGSVVIEHPSAGSIFANYNAIIERVAGAGPDGRVAVLRTSTLLAPEPGRLLPDGLHRSAEGHRLVAAAIADAIVERCPSGR